MGTGLQGATFGGGQVIVHFYSDYTPASEDALNRQIVAQQTWAKQPWRERPVLESELPRVWKEEGKQLPYVKDVFDIATADLPARAIAVYTNADICVRSDCALQIAGAMQDTEALYSFRRDFHFDFNAPMADTMIERGKHYPGTDLYAFRVSWWRANRASYPDMLIGIEFWDPVLRTLIERTNQGRGIVLPGVSYHRKHASFWEQAENRYRLRAQMHNLTLGRDWLVALGINPARYSLPTWLLKRPV
jgi:hypothetical protein